MELAIEFSFKAAEKATISNFTKLDNQNQNQNRKGKDLE